MEPKKRKVASKILESDFLRASGEFFANLTDHDKCVREEGEKKGIKNVAKQMRDRGKPLSEIIEFTGLSAEEINNL